MSRLISVSDDVYSKLTKLKGKDSYSVILRRLIVPSSNKEKILQFFGTGGVDEEKVKELKIGWKKWSDRYA
ncbi:TPA: hypothetical protein HA246_06025 [Candidatus Woesearchaeota archaeon]|nr:hypothetical protein [Candidatus Woesearchaeota archaeon]